jgi:hypothetical protein
MAADAWALQALLGQMIWWCLSTLPEPPPDGLEVLDPPPGGRWATQLEMPMR